LFFLTLLQERKVQTPPFLSPAHSLRKYPGWHRVSGCVLANPDRNNERDSRFGTIQPPGSFAGTAPRTTLLSTHAENRGHSCDGTGSCVYVRTMANGKRWRDHHRASPSRGTDVRRPTRYLLPGAPRINSIGFRSGDSDDRFERGDSLACSKAQRCRARSCG